MIVSDTKKRLAWQRCTPKSTSHSSASPGIPPELPAAHGPLPGDDETARLPLPVSMLPPWAASKRLAGALSPTDVALTRAA